MKKLFIFLVIILPVKTAQLDVKKIYPIVREVCSYRGAIYVGSNTLDCSHEDLDSLSGISELTVSFDGNLMPITKITRLRILATDNNLTTLPNELYFLSLIAIDVSGNKKLKIPKWIFSFGTFYVYFNSSLFRSINNELLK